MNEILDSLVYWRFHPMVERLPPEHTNTSEFGKSPRIVCSLFRLNSLILSLFNLLFYTLPELTLVD